MPTRTIKVDALARVEGEGALSLTFNGTEVESVKLAIFEPPRFFEVLLRGRGADEAPTSRSHKPCAAQVAHHVERSAC